MAQTEKLPFGESHWNYLPDLVQNYIQDLAARSLHRQRMKHVCQSIKLYGQRRSRIELDFEEMFYFYRSFFESGDERLSLSWRDVKLY